MEFYDHILIMGHAHPFQIHTLVMLHVESDISICRLMFVDTRLGQQQVKSFVEELVQYQHQGYMSTDCCLYFGFVPLPG
jgi:hypothetical protein